MLFMSKTDRLLKIRQYSGLKKHAKHLIPNENSTWNFETKFRLSRHLLIVFWRKAEKWKDPKTVETWPFLWLKLWVFTSRKLSVVAKIQLSIEFLLNFRIEHSNFFFSVLLHSKIRDFPELPFWISFQARFTKETKTYLKTLSNVLHTKARLRV